MNRRIFMKHAVSVVAGSLACQKVARAEGAKKPPNIIYILTDDQGWTSVSYRSDPNRPDSQSDYLETPHMARAARTGMRFTDAYAPNPICSPTRHAILFGQNAARHVYGKDLEWTKKAPAWLTIPKSLKEADPAYRAAHFGKWHVGVMPENLHFDYSDGPTSNSAGETVNGVYREKEGVEANLAQYNKKHGITPPTLNGRYSEFPVHYADGDPKSAFGMTRRAETFMRECIEDEKPFFAYIAHFATHLDMVSSKQASSHFKNKKKGEKHDNPFYAAMVKDMDSSIGRVLDFVQEMDIADNTYVFIMSDNGGVQHIAQTASLADDSNEVVDSHETSVVWRNLPLRHGKHEFYEGGIRVPFLVLGPGIEENSVCRQPVTGLDLLPTFADLAGHSMQLPTELDGGSLAPVLRNCGQGAIRRNRDALIFHQAANRIPISAIRKGRYKLVKHWLADNPGDLTSQYVGEKRLELYDLSEDVEERRDLSETMPERTQELNNDLMEFLNEVHAETRYTRQKNAYNAMLKARGLGSSRTIMAKPEYKSPFGR